MKYPIVQARENGRAETNAFLGINRLPEGREGEGAEFKNLSLDLYPAASTSGLSDMGEVIYIKNGEEAEAVIDFTKLQAVAELYEDGEKLYLTGVYDGDFYYKGQKKGYYACDNDAFTLSATDRVQIEKLGNVFVIFAFNDVRSKTWTYNTKNTENIHNEEAREKDGLLATEVIKYRLPGKTFTDEELGAQLYLYKIASGLGGQYSYTGVEQIEYDTKKQYYFITEIFDDVKYTKKTKEKIESDYSVFELCNGLVGSRLKIRTALEDLGKEYKEGDEIVSGDFYMFDDYDEEHPVTFVIDVAYGTNSYTESVIARLGEREKERYKIEAWSLENKNLETPNSEAIPYFLYNDTKTVKELKVAALNNEEDGYGLGTPLSKDYSYFKYGKGIIGHFERWNNDEKRYELYNSESDLKTIWRRVRVNNEGETVELLPHWYSKDIGDWVDSIFDIGTNSIIINNTAIPIKSIGIETEATKLSHITAYKGRIFGVVNDGTMLVCSEFGSYTDFGEFSGISTDSGYFNSLTAGKFTGISEYQGTLVVFKADRMSIYYGDTPSDMVLSHEIKNVGCIDSDSIKEVNGQLIFLGKDGFYAYSGGQPQHISRKLNKKYTSARAFAVGRKYYASVEDELLIYDTDAGAWTSSEAIEIKAICGERLFLADGSVKKVLDNEEWSGAWKYESMDMFEDIMDDKGINEIYIRAKLKGEMVVSTITDGGDIKEHQTITDSGERMKVWRVPVKFKHGNYYRIRIEGNGSCILYAIERKCYAGGRVR